ncbi:MAG TPA: metallophosphoesterase, partial [Steroidobacteraceae bacterium]|nr:metallophosphoesterase [Steroidobacteraceae bacterium]
MTTTSDEGRGDDGASESGVTPGDTVRVGIMSDLHVEFETDYWRRLERVAQRGDASRVADALRRRAELLGEPGHPQQGPDLRDLKASRVDLLLLAGDIHLGPEAVAYAEAAARYLDCRAFLCAGNHEAYGFDLPTLIQDLRRAAARTAGRAAFLERDRVDIEVRGRGG